MTPVLAFDIETIPDVDGIRKLYGLPAEVPDVEVAEIAFQKRRTVSHNDFLPPHLQRLIVLSCGLPDGVGGLPAGCDRREPRLLRDRLRQHLSPVSPVSADALRALARAVRSRARAAARLPRAPEPAPLARIPLALEELTVEIDSLDAEGRGVARKPDGKVLFVEGALPGERARVAIVERKRRHEFARALAIENASAERRAPRCPHFGICGGCVTQHATLEAQLAAKQDWLLQNLARIGKVTPERVNAPISGAEWAYRHRARLSVRRVP